ncbi:MAG: alanine racemase [Proteobacteria bacterium]|nr:MAG: alanine racemase [Pseudomonadota bacterium]
MMYPERGTSAHINLSHLLHNIEVFKKLHPGPIMAVVKADAYGHGLARVTDSLKSCDALAVATIEEAMQLRSFIPDKRILLLEGVFNAEELELAIEQRFDLVVHQFYQLDVLLKSSNAKPLLNVWLKVDTGMHRLGFDWADYPQVLDQLKQVKMIKEIRLMAHFAQSDQVDHQQTQLQLQRHQILQQHDFECSFANTGAVLNGLSCAGEWARVGLGLYGISPLADRFAADFDLRPVMQLSAKLISIKTVKQAETVGYSAQFTCLQDMLVGIVGMGYADGYPWSEHHSHVVIRGHQAPIIGRISMDMMAIDLSAVKQPLIGEPVHIWGSEQAVEQVAKELHTIPYTLVCGITGRVKFHVIDSL